MATVFPTQAVAGAFIPAAKFDTAIVFVTVLTHPVVVFVTVNDMV